MADNSYYLDREMTAPELNLENRYLRKRLGEMEDIIYKAEKVCHDKATFHLFEELLIHLKETIKNSPVQTKDLIDRFVRR